MKIPLVKAAINLIFPQRCIFCDEVTGDDGRCCKRCTNRLRCTGEGRLLQLGDTPVYSCFYYEGGAASSLKAFKFRGRRELAEYFSFELSNLLVEAGVDMAFDAVTYPPMPELREKGRGYNQAELLARGLAELHGLNCNGCGLLRADSFAQHDLHLGMRRKQKSAGFGIAPQAAVPRRVLLVDDVCTSGNSLRSCIALLRSAGAEETVAVTVCRARL